MYLFARNSLPYASYAAHHYVPCTVQPCPNQWTLCFRYGSTHRSHVVYSGICRRVLSTYGRTYARRYLGTYGSLSLIRATLRNAHAGLNSVKPLAASSLAPFLSFLWFSRKIDATPVYTLERSLRVPRRERILFRQTIFGRRSSTSGKSR